MHVTYPQSWLPIFSVNSVNAMGALLILQDKRGQISTHNSTEFTGRSERVILRLYSAKKKKEKMHIPSTLATRLNRVVHLVLEGLECRRCPKSRDFQSNLKCEQKLKQLNVCFVLTFSPLSPGSPSLPVLPAGPGGP